PDGARELFVCSGRVRARVTSPARTCSDYKREPDKFCNVGCRAEGPGPRPLDHPRRGSRALSTIKTVIVADDTAFVRDRFATALLSAGHTALTVKNAAELVARVRNDLARIDLVVLDLRLPHGGGVDLVRTIRKLDEGRLAILVFSGTIATAD